jgi:hypothetical protein
MDGIDSHIAKIGDTPDIPDELVDGLKAGGFISIHFKVKDAGASPENKMESGSAENKVEHYAEDGPVDPGTPSLVGENSPETIVKIEELEESEKSIIDNDPESDSYWRKLSATSMKELAMQITDEKINNKGDAEKAIEAYLGGDDDTEEDDGNGAA